MTSLYGVLRGHTVRMSRFMQSVVAARTALLTVGSFTAGTASVWTAWGTAPGLGAACVFLLWGAHLSADDKGSTS